MKIWIVWLPNVWKSTLFNALTKNYAADAANFPFCTIEPNVGVVDVKDSRVEKLAELSQSQKLIYAAIDFVDIAGLVKGASKGEWLGNQFLATIREVDAIVQVVRHFKDDDVVHVEGQPDPLRDVEIINMELIMADLQMVEKLIQGLERQLKSHDVQVVKLYKILEKMKGYLGEGKLAYDIADELNEGEKVLLKLYNFLTYKPFIYALNVAEWDLEDYEEMRRSYQEKLQKPTVVVCAKLEEELIDFDTDEKNEYLQDVFGTTKVPTLDDVIKLAFDTVWLMYYFTTGAKETRARTIPKNSTAPQAAWVIHTDFERGFIKADVVDYDKFVEVGGRTGAKEKWVLRLEGKDYIVQDGDVMLFKFNV